MFPGWLVAQTTKLYRALQERHHEGLLGLHGIRSINKEEPSHEMYRQMHRSP